MTKTEKALIPVARRVELTEEVLAFRKKYERYLSQQADSIKRASDFLGELHQRACGLPRGTPLSFMPGLEFAPAQVTAWAGQNNVGKSMILSQLTCEWLSRGEDVFCVSIEMTPVQLLARMFQQSRGEPLNEATEHLCAAWAEWLGDRFLLYKPKGEITPDRVLGGCLEAYSQHPAIRHIIIDNLMAVVPGEDTYNIQKNFVFELLQVAQHCNVHVHLVHHLKKMEPDAEIDQYALRGTSAISDRLDNIFVLIKNKAKDRAVADFLNNVTSEQPEDPDVTLALVKQRHGKVLDKRVPLWFNNKTLCFGTKFKFKSPVYVPETLWAKAEAEYDF